MLTKLANSEGYSLKNHDAPLGDSIGTLAQGGPKLMGKGLNLGKMGAGGGAAGKSPGPGFSLKSNMKLDGKQAGGGGKSITAGKKGSK